MYARPNYWITIFTLVNLLFVTISVWAFPRVWIFQITSTLAWILIIGQYIIAHRLHRGKPSNDLQPSSPESPYSSEVDGQTHFLSLTRHLAIYGFHTLGHRVK